MAKSEKRIARFVGTVVGIEIEVVAGELLVSESADSLEAKMAFAPLAASLGLIVGEWLASYFDDPPGDGFQEAFRTGALVVLFSAGSRLFLFQGPSVIETALIGFLAGVLAALVNGLLTLLPIKGSGGIGQAG